ncbi:MAG TPA: HD domain-containing phosphohydrolase [Gemmatimonadaceae bacterium]|nr:HD domain-containing phosphohydrolase [Gemmatimonadaceae bacterium]
MTAPREFAGRRARSLTPATLSVASATLAETLINAMEAKNAYLRGHSQRVADLAASTAEALGLPEELVEQVRLAGRLHDIGKIGIRESVLDKPGPLTPDEYAHVRDHVRIGLEILAPVAHLGVVLDFIGDHHERFDGSGYPRGLSGDAISVGGRILAAADTFDALTSRRAYRDSRTEEETLGFMRGLVEKALFADVFDALCRVVGRRQSLVFLGEAKAPGAHHHDHGHAAFAGPGGVSAGGGLPADASHEPVRDLAAAVGDLPRAERLALTLHYLEDLSDAEIEGVLEAEPASAFALRRRALRRVAGATEMP